MRPSYIGVTGITSKDQAECIIPSKHSAAIMIGVLVSSKTLRGETNKYPNRYPKPQELGKIFGYWQNTLNLIHFNTKEPEKLLDDMCLAQDLAGPNCHGFQLNIVWPDRRVLGQYKRHAQFEHKIVVLQCGTEAMREFGNDAANIAKQVMKYEGLIDYVLIDPSGGVGKEFDVEFASECFTYLRDISSIGFGIAGGLEANNLDRLRPLLRKFPNFSIDAEGRLRNAEDHLDIRKTQDYVTAAMNLYKEYAA